MILNNEIWLRLVLAQDEGFKVKDLYTLRSQNFTTYEALDWLKNDSDPLLRKPEPENGYPFGFENQYDLERDLREPPWFFKIVEEKLQVRPNTI